MSIKSGRHPHGKRDHRTNIQACVDQRTCRKMNVSILIIYLKDVSREIDEFRVKTHLSL